MEITLSDLIKDTSKVDLEDICSSWQWCLQDMKAIALITCLGDMFFIGKDEYVYRLETGECHFEKVADSHHEFEQLLNGEKFDEWLLPLLVEKLIKAGKVLNENQVYSFKKPSVLGDEYSLENIEPTNISVHFAFSGQICEQIKDLPDGTKVNIKFEAKKD